MSWWYLLSQVAISRHNEEIRSIFIIFLTLGAPAVCDVGSKDETQDDGISDDTTTEGDDDDTSEGIFSDDGNAIISGGDHGRCMDFYWVFRLNSDHCNCAMCTWNSMLCRQWYVTDNI